MTRALKLRIAEADFQATVIDYAHTQGWLVAHFRVAMTNRGWRTPVTADGAGWPDLVLVRDRMVVAELKGTDGRLAPNQRRWLDALRTAGIEAYCWWPTDWDQIETTLARSTS